MQTYSSDELTTDSAAAANAMFTGIKTKSGTFGFDARIDRNDPYSMLTAHKLESILTLAQESGRETGAMIKRIKKRPYRTIFK